MKNSLLYRCLAQLVCIPALVVFLYPLALMIQKSFGVNGIANYRLVFDYYDLRPNFATSLIVVGGTLVVMAAVVSMAAYAFSKLQFPFKKGIYYLLLTAMMIPTSAVIFPLYQIVRVFRLNNTGFSLIFPYATGSCCFNLMFLKNYYDALPNELLDSARIDGAGKWKTFLLIMLPIAKPGLVFALMQTFLSSWNELQMGMIFINDTSRQPLSVVPLRFAQTTSATGFTVNHLFAACIICLLPIGIFYVFASRYMVEGLTQGAVKG
ncbi:carbohydrate ABC transporter permease [Lachnoclostridium sp. Marseille-P6806]|uniref:carbohydrate ABC transporter permease n=1 Tax=Lachnoclostridium sp. Marseille-P6806 TaxID=2364793 RepID=UPI0010321B91|nr:carbohydrate ABC transporter permease [Lachnoclostridium sp. Marseille-P6806]